MARSKRISVAGINVTIDPHSPARYRSLLLDAFSLKLPIRVRGDQHLLLSNVSSRPRLDGSIRGRVARFTELDADGDWFDALRLDSAEARDVQSIHIPANLKPNYVAFFFAFYPNRHRLVFEVAASGKRLSPRLMENFLEQLFNHPQLRRKYGDVNVNFIADRSMLPHILGLSQLRKLTIVIKKPNPDDQADFEASIRRRMRKLRARRQTEIIEAESGSSIRPDEEVEQLAEMALSNGRVESEGRDAQGNPDKRSSDDHPRIEQITFDPDTMSEEQAFSRAAHAFTQTSRAANPRAPS